MPLQFMKQLIINVCRQALLINARHSSMRYVLPVLSWLSRNGYKITLLVFFVISAFVIQHHIDVALNWLRTLDGYAPYLFVFLYCLMSVFCLPNVVLALAGGAIFGLFEGTLLNLLGATVGAGCGFCISRYTLFNDVKSWRNARVKQIIIQVERRGWRAVAFLRLMPIPYNLVNYALGATKIKFSQFLLATAIFLIPNKLILTYCGYKSIALYQFLHSVIVH
jgi:uncharacterized membrane protein YdjX (TVP38/TMEM64 family)